MQTLHLLAECGRSTLLPAHRLAAAPAPADRWTQHARWLYLQQTRLLFQALMLLLLLQQLVQALRLHRCHLPAAMLLAQL
jgi:hypothetical protein